MKSSIVILDFIGVKYLTFPTDNHEEKTFKL